MRKIVVITIIILAAVSIFFVMRRASTTDKTGTPATGETKTFRPDPSSATFMVDDEKITLSAGRNERSIAPESTIMEETVLMDKFAYGDINADGKEDTTLFLARSGGGSGTFIYLAAFVSGPVTYRGSSAVFIGDRVSPQSISISKGIVTVTYLDRKSGEAFAAEPTVPVSKQFVYRNGEFQER